LSLGGSAYAEVDGLIRIPDLAGGSGPAAVDTNELEEFFWQLERLLRRLGDLHLRISLARLNTKVKADGWRPTARRIADRLEDPCALSGVMPDGSVVAAFLGPRGEIGESGDREMTSRIVGRFDAAASAAGLERSRDLTVVHCWTDEIYDVPSLVLDLAGESQRRRLAAPREYPEAHPI
jgi:hypothetical protein